MALPPSELELVPQQISASCYALTENMTGACCRGTAQLRVVQTLIYCKFPHENWNKQMNRRPDSAESECKDTSAMSNGKLPLCSPVSE